MEFMGTFLDLPRFLGTKQLIFEPNMFAEMKLTRKIHHEGQGVQQHPSKQTPRLAAGRFPPQALSLSGRSKGCSSVPNWITWQEKSPLQVSNRNVQTLVHDEMKH